MFYSFYVEVYADFDCCQITLLHFLATVVSWLQVRPSIDLLPCSSLNISTATEWSAMKFCTDIPENSTDFGDPVTLPLEL